MILAATLENKSAASFFASSFTAETICGRFLISSIPFPCKILSGQNASLGLTPKYL